MKKAIICVQDALIPRVLSCLKDASYKCVAVEDQADGLQLLSNGIYDLVVAGFASNQKMSRCIEQIQAVSNAAILVLVLSESYYDIGDYLEKADDALLSSFDTQELPWVSQISMPWNAWDTPRTIC